MNFNLYQYVKAVKAMDTIIYYCNIVYIYIHTRTGTHILYMLYMLYMLYRLYRLYIYYIGYICYIYTI